MLTLAEEQGLAGLAVASRVQHALYRLAPAELAGLIERLRAGALAPATSSTCTKATVEPIRILPAPITVLPDQVAYVHHVTLTVQEALKRLPSLYLHDFTVREILRLPDAEERWLRECWGPSQEAHNPIFGRLDALIDFTSPMWQDTLRFVEPNLMRHRRPAHGADLRAADRGHRRAGAAGGRPRTWTSRSGQRHARAADPDAARPHGRHRQRARRSASSSPSTPATAPTSRRSSPAISSDRHGLTVMHADPSELELRDGAVWHERRAGRPGLSRLRRGGPARARGRGRGRRADAGAAAGEPHDLVDRRRPRPEGLLGGADRPAALPAVLHAPRSGSSSSGTFSGPGCCRDRRTVLPDGRQGNLLEFVADPPRSAGAQAQPRVRRRRHRDRPGGDARRMGDRRMAGGAGRPGRPLGGAAAGHRSRCGSSRWSGPTARCTSSRSTR